MKRHIRERHSSKPKEDLFGFVFEQITPGPVAGPNPETGNWDVVWPIKKMNYEEIKKMYEPEPGPAMKPEEAFEQLRRLIK